MPSAPAWVLGRVAITLHTLQGCKKLLQCIASIVGAHDAPATQALDLRREERLAGPR